KRLRFFYDLKREEGKPYRVAIIACANKLLHWIYAMLKTKTIPRNCLITGFSNTTKTFQIEFGGLFELCIFSIS
ncbi:hypothetical protein D7X33_44890, partial [Butyricicoccus sp. 1XD8-22]